MKTVYETIGLTGSGKSTWARYFIKDRPKIKIVSPDGFRSMLNGEYAYHVELDDVITQSTYDTAKNLLEAGYDVVIDCGNLTNASDRRGKWRQLPADKFIAVMMPMDKPVEWYVDRRKTNPHWPVNVEQIVMNEMKAYEPPKLGEFDKIIHITAKEIE